MLSTRNRKEKKRVPLTFVPMGSRSLVLPLMPQTKALPFEAGNPG